MKKVLLTISTAFLWLLLDQAHAITLSFDPISAEITQGSGVEVNLVISGLGTGTAPSLGTFDLDVDYDASLLGVSNVLFADQLDLFGLGSTTDWESIDGSVNLFELSLDQPSDLELLQLDSFTLATLSFDTLGVGSSLLSYSNVFLGDAGGNPLFADLMSEGNITVLPAVAISEPAMLWLMGFGLAGMGLGRKLKTTVVLR
ncbi:MAG: hypothetical protein QNL62_10130 [Gammaproteobacteria bacterium]|nr:hypothetical protein [Gammaproteobacteria bacterium]